MVKECAIWRGLFDVAICNSTGRLGRSGEGLQARAGPARRGAWERGAGRGRVVKVLHVERGFGAAGGSVV